MKKLLFLAMCAGALNGFVYGVDSSNKNNAKISDITYYFKPELIRFTRQPAPPAPIQL
jgi:hypothetical protein